VYQISCLYHHLPFFSCTAKPTTHSKYEFPLKRIVCFRMSSYSHLSEPQILAKFDHHSTFVFRLPIVREPVNFIRKHFRKFQVYLREYHPYVSLIPIPRVCRHTSAAFEGGLRGKFMWIWVARIDKIGSATFCEQTDCHIRNSRKRVCPLKVDANCLADVLKDQKKSVARTDFRNNEI